MNSSEHVTHARASYFLLLIGPAFIVKLRGVEPLCCLAFCLAFYMLRTLLFLGIPFGAFPSVDATQPVLVQVPTRLALAP